MSESIAQRLIDAAAKIATEASLLIGNKVGTTKFVDKAWEAFCKLAQEVERCYASWKEDEEENHKYIAQMNVAYERDQKQIEEFKQRESLWQKLDGQYRAWLTLNHNLGDLTGEEWSTAADRMGLIHRQIQELRRKLGLMEES